MDESYQYRTHIPAQLYYLEDSLTLETVLTVPVLYELGGYPGNDRRRVTRAIVAPLPPSSQVEWREGAGLGCHFSLYAFCCSKQKTQEAFFHFRRAC